MQAEALRFDDASRCSFSDQPVPPGGVPRAVRLAAESAGLDPLAELYNEALRLAHEGEIKAAGERLRMLLAMEPEDGESLLLLARLLVAGQKWEDALSTLDDAEAVGVAVPPELRRAVEDHQRADKAADDEQRQALNAREQGEIKALRAEARRLRSENAQLLGRTADLEKEVSRSMWATTGVAVLATAFMLLNLAFGGGSATEVEATDAVADADASAEVVAAAGVAEAGADATAQAEANTPKPAAKPATATTIADRASKALAAAPGLDGTVLEVEVAGGKATLRGVVPTFRHRKTAEKVLLGIDGVKEVAADGVVVKARTEGTTHKVRGGDSLSKISYEYYGEASKSSAILKANQKDLGGKADLVVGQTLKIPAID